MQSRQLTAHLQWSTGAPGRAKRPYLRKHGVPHDDKIEKRYVGLGKDQIGISAILQFTHEKDKWDSFSRRYRWVVLGHMTRNKLLVVERWEWWAVVALNSLGSEHIHFVARQAALLMSRHKKVSRLITKIGYCYDENKLQITSRC